jgi:hypothetical protein
MGCTRVHTRRGLVGEFPANPIILSSYHPRLLSSSLTLILSPSLALTRSHPIISFLLSSDHPIILSCFHAHMLSALSAPETWYPELQYKLGAPLSGYTRDGWVYTRSFEFADVRFDAAGVMNSAITWK